MLYIYIQFAAMKVAESARVKTYYKKDMGAAEHDAVRRWIMSLRFRSVSVSLALWLPEVARSEYIWLIHLITLFLS